MLQKYKENNLVTGLLLLFFLSIALLIRYPNLGKWCFTSDEFIFFKSINFILKRGFPEFPGGGYYNRGIGLQYLTLLPVVFFKNKEFAVRLIPLVFGALSVPLFFILSRKFLSLVPAILCTSMLLLSSWHIEFSRFARFYAPFQLFFLLFVLYFYRGFWGNNKRDQAVAIAIGFVSILVYEESLIIALLLFIPVILGNEEKRQGQKRAAIYVLLLLAANILFVKGLGSLNLGMHNPFPAEYVKFHSSLASSPHLHSIGPVFLPDTGLFQSMWHSQYLLPAFIFISLSGLLIGIKTVKFEKCYLKLSIVFFLLILSLLHQFGLLVAALIFITVIFKKEVFSIDRRIKKFLFIYIATAFLFWIIVVYGTGNGKYVKYFLLGYPPIKYAVIIPFAKSVPLWSLFASGTILIGILHTFLGHQNDSEKFILTLILFCVIVVSFFKTPYRVTRYCFFFFPLIFILAYIETEILVNTFVNRWGSGHLFKNPGILLVIPIVLFLFTDDFFLKQVVNVSSAEINFRLGKYAPFQDHWFERKDWKTPALYLNEVYHDGDRIVIDSVTFAQYLEKPYLFFAPMSAPWFNEYSRKSGTELSWTGTPLIFKIDKIIKKIPHDNRRSLWLIGQNYLGKEKLSDIEKKYNLEVKMRYTGIDGRFKVWEIKRKKLDNKIKKII